MIYYELRNELGEAYYALNHNATPPKGSVEVTKEYFYEVMAQKANELEELLVQQSGSQKLTSIISEMEDMSAKKIARTYKKEKIIEAAEFLGLKTKTLFGRKLKELEIAESIVKKLK